MTDADPPFPTAPPGSRHGRLLHALAAAILAIPLLAAAPQRGLSLQVPGDASPLPGSNAPATPPPPPKYRPAPLPNRDLEAPNGPRAKTDASVAPSLITRGDTYRGEGFSKGSSPQNEQERRVKPGAGFNLTVPFAPN